MSHALSRAATLDRAKADGSQRTVPASLSSETPVKRGYEIEILRHDPASIDLTRAVDGLPLLFNHDRAEPIGVVENVRLENRRLVGMLRFGMSTKATEVWNDVQSGVLKHISVSYSVEATEPTEGGYIASKWTPFESSIVSVPADVTVGVGRSSPTTTNITTGAHNMPEIINREAEAAQVRSLAERYSGQLPQGFGDSLNARGVGLDAARDEIIEALARRDFLAGGQVNVRREVVGQGVGREARFAQMQDALCARIGGAAVPRENPYRDARLVDMARDVLEMSGVRTTSMSSVDLVERGLHTTSDFPELLTASGQRVLRQAYQAYVGGLKRICKPSTARDFRAKSRLMLGEAPELLQVNEHGEFKFGSMAEAKSSYALGTYGRIFGISRQALVNDDLDAFGDMVARLGQSSAMFEAKFLVSLLTSNPNMSDGLALFHATHGNLATGAGSALQMSALTAARKAMRLQTGLDGKTPIDAQPTFLVVPAALETAGEQLLTTIQPTVASDVNPFAGKLELVVDPRLDAVSATAWYLAADPAKIDGIEYSYLESAGGPEVIAKEGFDTDGMQMKVRLDFGAGALDWRGLYKSTGV